MELYQFLESLPVSYKKLEERLEDIRACNSDQITSGEEETFKWMRWEDGAGNEGVFILLPQLQKALIYGYDHESAYNFYDTPHASEQQVVFDGLPEIYQDVVTSKTLQWSWDDTNTIYATCAFWIEEDSMKWTHTTNHKFDWNYDNGGAPYTLKLMVRSRKEVKDMLS